MTEETGKKNPAFDTIAQFAVKTAIFVFIISLGLKMVTPALRDALDSKWGNVAKALAKEDARIILTGYFVHNPAVHWKISELREKNYEYDKAVLEMELATGLLELNNADIDVRKRYQLRLDKLRKLAIEKDKK